MNKDLIQYGNMVEAALLGVVRNILHNTAQEGLNGDHHFYITCKTGSLGITLPKYLEASYPDEITLVIQHQYWDLEVDDNFFNITLSFNGKKESLHVPFKSITSFVDPSVEFGLQFNVSENNIKQKDLQTEISPADSFTNEDKSIINDSKSDQADENVVSLDTFRRN